MKSSNLFLALILLVVESGCLPAFGQTQVGLNAYASMVRPKEAVKLTFALSKPLPDHGNSVVASGASVMLVPVSTNALPDGYYARRLSRRGGPDKHAVGVGMLIGGGVCLIAGGVLLNAAANNSMDDWGFSYVVETIGGYVVGGCGIGLSVTGLVLVLKYRDGGHNR